MTTRAVLRVLWWWVLWHPLPGQALEGLPPVRIIEEPCLHVGLRPHSDGTGTVITLQVTTCW